MTNAAERARKREIRLKKEARAEKTARFIKNVMLTVLIMAVMLVVAVGLTGVLFQNPERTIEMMIIFATWAVGMWLFAKVFEKEEKHGEGR